MESKVVSYCVYGVNDIGEMMCTIDFDGELAVRECILKLRKWFPTWHFYVVDSFGQYCKEFSVMCDRCVHIVK